MSFSHCISILLNFSHAEWQTIINKYEIYRILSYSPRSIYNHEHRWLLLILCAVWSGIKLKMKQKEIQFVSENQTNSRNVFGILRYLWSPWVSAVTALMCLIYNIKSVIAYHSHAYARTIITVVEWHLNKNDTTNGAWVDVQCTVRQYWNLWSVLGLVLLNRTNE